MEIHTDPYFWALVSMLGLEGGTLVVTGHPLGRKVAFLVRWVSR